MTSPSTIDWPAVWETTGELLRLHLDAGRRHLLTEDALRFATVVALDEAGVDAERLALDWPAPELAEGTLDLVVDVDSTPAVVDFAFPRDAWGAISPDAKTFGSLLNDFHRVSQMPATSRWVVQLLDDRLLRYVGRVAGGHSMPWTSTQGDDIELSGSLVSTLPRAARDHLDGWATEETVSARCEHSVLLPEDLSLVVFSVSAQPHVQSPTARPKSLGALQPFSATARQELLAAAEALLERDGDGVLRKTDLIEEAFHRGSRHKRNLLSQMISVHLSVRPGREGYGQYADFQRVGQGLYRFRRHDA